MLVFNIAITSMEQHCRIFIAPHVHTYVCMRAAPKNFFAGVEKCKQFAHFDKCHLILIVSSTVYTYELYIFYIYVGLSVHVAVFECDENDKLRCLFTLNAVLL